MAGGFPHASHVASGCDCRWDGFELSRRQRKKGWLILDPQRKKAVPYSPGKLSLPAQPTGATGASGIRSTGRELVIAPQQGQA